MRVKTKPLDWETYLCNVKVKVINSSSNPLPEYQTPGSAGMDIRANIEEAIQLESLDRILVPTGLRIELPMGFEAQIRPRSGMAFKRGLSLPNTPATIDSDYRGEIKVAIINLSREVQIIDPGERIAQLVIAKVETVEWQQVNEIEETERAGGGFGHTGSK